MSSTARLRPTPELLILTLLSLLTRCWDLFAPEAVIWDEQHFERFAGAYLTHRYYLDVHPPLAKMLIAWFGHLFGAPISAFVQNQPAPEARILPAVAGALIIPAVYLILRELRAGRRAATLGAAFLLLDNALLLESRLILTDSLLVLFGFLALLFYLVARRHSGWSRAAYVAAAALSAGAAFSTKWTGLSALGLVLLLFLADAIRERHLTPARLGEAVALVLIPIAVYVAAFAVHFGVLDHTGPGAFTMSPSFQSTLVGHALYSPDSSMSLLAKMAELNRVMKRINIAWAVDTHPGASPWYTWPIAKHSLGFWRRESPATHDVQWIILFGNPIVWLGTLAGMLVVVVQWLRRDARILRHRWPLAFLGVGYLVNFLPFAFIARPMFLYHYFFALIFSVMFMAVGVGALCGWDANDDTRFAGFNRRGASVWFGGLALCAALFLYMAPMTYGWPLSAEGVSHRMHVIERH